MKQKPSLLLMMPVPSPVMAKLENEFVVYADFNDKGIIANKGDEINGLFTSSVIGASPDLLSRLPALKMISCSGAGFDNIDLAGATRRNIIVTHTPGVLDNAVADMALALLLSLVRQLVVADKFVRNGNWEKEKFRLSKDISGMVCGIVGMGNIGKQIARRVEAFNMKVCYFGRHQKPELTYRYYSELESIARDSDILILSIPANKETYRLINEKILTALGSGGYLINISRGSVLDQSALVTSLITGKIAGAALDVFDNEPHVPAALTSLDNVVLSPHISSATTETRMAMAELAYANLHAFFCGLPVLTPVKS